MQSLRPVRCLSPIPMPKTNRVSRALSIVPKRFARDREAVREFIRRGQRLVKALNAPALLGEVDQLAASARKPFLFVAVGEVKSGKSSLINALLETPVCAVDSAPCTDRVQEISYGEVKQRIEVSEFEERLHLPHAILRHISIVDTPGTNSILRHHQLITEHYIPQSDLVLFVFFAKNPYTGSAWDLLHRIQHDWQRNTLFVLQQADLLDAGELGRTVSRVRRQLAEEGIAKPVVFAVSVLNGEGVGRLRDYLRTEVVKGRQFNKNISLTHNLLRLLRRLEGTLEKHACLLQHDEDRLGELRRLVRETGDAAGRVYESLAALARRHAEEARSFLDAHFVGTRGPFSTAANPTPKGRDRPFSAAGLRKMGQGLVGSAVLRDALSSGWQTLLRLDERFNQLQGELTRCLFRAELNSLNLCQHRQRHALQLLETIATQPPCLTEPPRDGLAHRRLQTLQKVRHAVQTIGAWRSQNPLPQLPAMRMLSRWSFVDRVVHAGGGLGFLFLGYYLSDLFTGLFLGVMGYLGIGFGLAARNRARIGGQARQALDQTLAEIDQRLRAILLVQASRLQGALQNALDRFEVNVAQRRVKINELHVAITGLREEVERFESAAWHDAVEDEE